MGGTLTARHDKGTESIYIEELRAWRLREGIGSELVKGFLKFVVETQTDIEWVQAAITDHRAIDLLDKIAGVNTARFYADPALTDAIPYHSVRSMLAERHRQFAELVVAYPDTDFDPAVHAVVPLCDLDMAGWQPSYRLNQ